MFGSESWFFESLVMVYLGLGYIYLKPSRPIKLQNASISVILKLNIYPQLNNLPVNFVK